MRRRRPRAPIVGSASISSLRGTSDDGDHHIHDDGNSSAAALRRSRVSFAAPAFLSDLARAQGAVSQQPRRAVPRRRQRRAEHAGSVHAIRSITAAGRRSPCPPGRCCRSAPTRSGKALGLHPRLTGLQSDLQRGPARDHPAHRLPELEPLALPGHRHLGHGEPATPQGTGWLGRYLDTLPAPIDPLAGWNTSRETPRALHRRDTVGVPSITEPSATTLSPARTAAPKRSHERNARHAHRVARAASIVRTSHSSTRARMAAFATLDRVGSVVNYQPSVTYPNNGFGAGAAAPSPASIAQRHRHASVSGCRPAASTRTRAQGNAGGGGYAI